jgi:Uma2 family endonuclease
MSARQPVPVALIDYPAADGEPMAETDVHRDLMLVLIFALTHFFQTKPDVYVSGNLFIYYRQGNPKKRVAPDVFMVRGVGHQRRRTYKLWEEGRPPDLVIELSSRQTWREDFDVKLPLYEQLGVKECFFFDPEYDYLPDPLVGYRLEGDEYVALKVVHGRVRSQVLKLDLVDTGETLRFFDPRTKRFLPTPEEAAAAAARAEAEVARLRRELERLRKK